MNNLAVLSTYFNPVGYEVHRTKYLRFRQCLGECNLFMAEASWTGQFETDACLKIHATDRNILWQKERMLNLLIQTLPAQYEFIAIIDADIILQCYDWQDRTLRMLEQFPVGQPWSQSHLFGVKDSIAYSFPSYCRKINENIEGYGHPGFLWAARREVIEDGLIDVNIVGGGDAIQIAGWLGKSPKSLWYIDLNKEWLDVITEKAEVNYKKVKGQLGYADGALIHLFHGTRAKRNYVDRYEVPNKCNFCPRKHLEIDDNGLWRWSATVPEELIDFTRSYFYDRDEDNTSTVPKRQITLL